MRKSEQKEFSDYCLRSPEYALLTLEEMGAFHHLVLYLWEDPDRSIPNEPAELATLSKLGEKWNAGSGEKILKMFQEHPATKNLLVLKYHFHRLRKALSSARLQRKVQKWCKNSTEIVQKRGRNKISLVSINEITEQNQEFPKPYPQDINTNSQDLWKSPHTPLNLEKRILITPQTPQTQNFVPVPPLLFGLKAALTEPEISQTPEASPEPDTQEKLFELVVQVPEAEPKEVQIRQVFTLWQNEFKKTRARLDSKRHRKIETALFELHFPMEEIEKAFIGWQYCDHCTGKNRKSNPEGKVYDDLGTILRDSAQIERFIALYEKHHAKAQAAEAARKQAQAEEAKRRAERIALERALETETEEERAARIAMIRQHTAAFWQNQGKGVAMTGS